MEYLMFNFFSKKPKVVLSPIIEDTIQRLGTPFGSRTCDAHTDSSDYDYFFSDGDLSIIIDLLKDQNIKYKAKNTYAHALDASTHITTTINNRIYDLVSFRDAKQIEGMRIAAQLSKAYSEYYPLNNKKIRYFVFTNYFKFGKHNKNINQNLLDFIITNFPELLI